MSLAEDEQLVSVSVPVGYTAGDTLRVSAPDQRVYEVVVPVGINPGGQINVIVKKSVEDRPSSVIGEEPTSSNSYVAVGGAVGAGAIVGSVVIGGLITGPVLVGGAVLYGATRRDSVGDAVRSAGAKVVDSARYVHSKAKEYKVVEKTKAAASATYSAAKDVDQKYDISGKAAAAGTAALGFATMGYNYFTNNASNSAAPAANQQSQQEPVPARVVQPVPAPAPRPAPVAAPVVAPIPTAPPTVALPIPPPVYSVDDGDGVVSKSVESYEGERNENGQPHGFGILTVGDCSSAWAGTTYKGHWFRGMRHGEGMLTHSNGDIYIGSFRDDKKDGKGQLRDVNNHLIRDGNWFNNQPC